MDGTSVPKAAIHEYRHPLLGKGKIGFACQKQMAAPAFDAVCAKDAYHADLRVLVAGRADGSHDGRSLLFCKYIGHVLAQDF